MRYRRGNYRLNRQNGLYYARTRTRERALSSFVGFIVFSLLNLRCVGFVWVVVCHTGYSIRQLLAVMKTVRVTDSILDSSPQTLNGLRSGCGALVCAVLQRLAAGALQTQFGHKMVWRPDYQRRDDHKHSSGGGGGGEADVQYLDADEEQLLNWDAPTEQIEDAAMEGEGGEGGDGFDAEPSPTTGAAADVKDDQPFVSRVDPIKWTVELERLAAAGHFRTSGSSGSGAAGTNEWRRHLDAAQKHKLLLSESVSNGWSSSNVVSKMAGLRKDLDRISRVETRMTTQFSELCGDLSVKKSELDRLSVELQSKKSSVDELIAQFESVSDQVRSAADALKANSSAMGETAPLIKLKTALSDLKTEVEQLNMRVGIVGAVLASRLAAEPTSAAASGGGGGGASAAAKRSAAAAKTADDESDGD